MDPYLRPEDETTSSSASRCSPRLDPSFGLAQVIKDIKDKNADLIVLDCIGYSSIVKEKIRQSTGNPVLLPRTLRARMIKELL
jgi:Asp/Glu/hydantoin racemase